MANETLTLEQLNEKVAQQSEVIKQQGELISSLMLQLAQKADAPAAVEEKPKLPEEPVKHKGKTYKFRVPVFMLPGTTVKIKASEAATDEKLISQIIGIEGQQILKELV